jgi:hypothetical protein
LYFNAADAVEIASSILRGATQRFRALWTSAASTGGHECAVNMDDWPDDATVPSFGPVHAAAASLA